MEVQISSAVFRENEAKLDATPKNYIYMQPKVIETLEKGSILVDCLFVVDQWRSASISSAHDHGSVVASCEVSGEATWSSWRGTLSSSA